MMSLGLCLGLSVFSSLLGPNLLCPALRRSLLSRSGGSECRLRGPEIIGSSLLGGEGPVHEVVNLEGHEVNIEHSSQLRGSRGLALTQLINFMGNKVAICKVGIFRNFVCAKYIKIHSTNISTRSSCFL